MSQNKVSHFAKIADSRVRVSALGVGLGLEGILRDLGDHEALEGRKTN